MADDHFVGRTDELARFGTLLAELVADGSAGIGRLARRRSGLQAGDGKSRVVLVHGLGGSGKSQLLRHFRRMVQGSLAGAPVSARSVRVVWLDWEDERQDDPGSYAAMGGPSLVTVLDAVQKAAVSASGNSARAVEQTNRAFSDYRDGAARMPEYAAGFADVLGQSRTSGSPFTSEDAAALAKAAASAGLLAVGHPVGFLGLTPEQLTAAAQASGHLSAAATRALTGKKPGEVSPQEYELVTDPTGELIRRVAAGVRTMASQAPLVILLDTGEVIGDRAWGWLRRVMMNTGSRVIWIVGARFESEAEAGANSPIVQFIRHIGDEHLILMSPTRFDNTMIRSYLEHRQTVRSYTNAEIDLIAGFTKGLPLAISFIATLLDQGQPVREACQELDDGYPSSVVSRLARRYLVHAEQQTFPAADPRRDDVTKILGLALAFGDLRNDPELLAALWNIELAEVQAAFEDLANRHDFVLPISHRLHDEVRDTLRTDLLDPFQRARAEQINRRALALFSDRLARMGLRWPTVDDQISHTDFTASLLGALWHALWADNQKGLDLFIYLLPVVAVVDPPTADAFTAMIEHFSVTFNQEQLRDLDLLTQTQPNAILDDLLLGRESTTRIARRVKITLSGLALRAIDPYTDDYVIGEPGDRQVAVMILQASLYAGELDETAVRTLQTAARQVSSTRLREAIGSQAQAIGTRLLWGDQARSFAHSALGAEAVKLATEMLPDNARVWEAHGAVLDEFGFSADAQAAHDRARAIDPGITGHFLPYFETDSSRLGNRYRGVIKRFGRDPRAKGFILTTRGRYEEGLAAFEQAVLLAPGDPSAHMSWGEVLLLLKRYDEALAVYDQAVRLTHGDPAIYASRGKALRYLGRYEEALAAFEQAVLLAPDDLSAHISWGEVLLLLKRYDEALAVYDQAVRLTHGDSAIYASRGKALRHLGRYEEALAAYEQVLAARPGDPDATIHRGMMLIELGRYGEVLAAFDRGLFSSSDHPDHVSRQEALRHRSRYEVALAAYEQVLAADPSDLGTARNRGLVLIALGRYGEALAAYNQALLLAPDDPAGHAIVGEILRYRGRHEEALAAYDRALVRNPSTPATHAGRGEVLRFLGRYEEALAAYDQAVLLAPDDPTAQAGRGEILRYRGHYEEALAAYDRALVHNPSTPAIQAGRGEALRFLGRYEEALAAYDQALVRDPSDTGAIRNLGFALMTVGRYEEALAAYDQAVTLEPDDPAGHTSRGEVLRLLGRYEEALAAYDQALVRDPSNADAFKNPGLALMSLGRYEEAMAAFDQALQRCPGTVAHENKGIALSALGYLDLALAEFDAAERLEPEGAGEARTWAGAILWHLKDLTAARDKFAFVKGRVSGRTPFRTAEIEAIALCGIGQSDAAERYLLDALPLQGPGDRGEPRRIYELLADPLLPGINRLSNIINNDLMQGN